MPELTPRASVALVGEADALEAFAAWLDEQDPPATVARRAFRAAAEEARRRAVEARSTAAVEACGMPDHEEVVR